MKKILYCLIAVATLLPACANKKPIEEKPYYVYLLLYGGMAKGYPVGDQSLPELDVLHNDLIGSMCLKIEDWERKEALILKLKAMAEE